MLHAGAMPQLPVLLAPQLQMNVAMFRMREREREESRHLERSEQFGSSATEQVTLVIWY